MGNSSRCGFDRWAVSPAERSGRCWSVVRACRRQSYRARSRSNRVTFLAIGGAISDGWRLIAQTSCPEGKREKAGEPTAPGKDPLAFRKNSRDPLEKATL
jgi:hypothetical protein